MQIAPPTFFPVIKINLQFGVVIPVRRVSSLR
jgi:hypothetical protein